MRKNPSRRPGFFRNLPVSPQRGGEAPQSERARWGLSGLRLGISLGGVSAPGEWKQALSWVELAEQLGLHSVWVPEMHFARGASTSPLLTLSGFAARSKRLRLGTTSLLLPIHPPEQLARDAVSLDALSGGRAILGLGRGFRQPLFAGFGVDASSKRDRFDQALDRILELWQNGETGRLLQHPHPPLAVAAFGRKGLLQAARRGLPYLASPVETLEQLVENQLAHREHLPDHRAAEDVVVPIMRTVHVARDDAEATRVAASLEGETRAISGRVPAALARAAQAGIEKRAVIGTSQRVVDQLGVYREQLGMDLLIARPQVPGVSDGERRDALARLADDVLPALS